jgi:hypothetical protein
MSEKSILFSKKGPKEPKLECKPTSVKEACEISINNSGLKKRDLKSLHKQLEDPLNCQYKEEFTCISCLLILENPVKCRKCEKFVCKKCIEEWLLYKNTCPNCV